MPLPVLFITPPPVKSEEISIFLELLILKIPSVSPASTVITPSSIFLSPRDAVVPAFIFKATLLNALLTSSPVPLIASLPFVTLTVEADTRLSNITLPDVLTVPPDNASARVNVLSAIF